MSQYLALSFYDSISFPNTTSWSALHIVSIHESHHVLGTEKIVSGNTGVLLRIKPKVQNFTYIHTHIQTLL
jgi:hypothetical protein